MFSSLLTIPGLQSSTPSGNFRIFEGMWQGASFHLERILDVVESMPDKEPFTCLRSSIQALLTLSEAVAERAGLREHILGQGVPLAALPPDVVRNMSIARGFIEFTDDELARIGIARASLSEAGHADRIAQSLQLLCCWAGMRGSEEHVLFPHGNILAFEKTRDSEYSRTVT